MTLSQHAFESRYDQEFNLDYLLYLPPDYDADTTAPYPLIMFLHGAGERSHDLSGVLTQGIPKRLSEGDDLPFIVIAPHCPPDQT
ncbi:MAG: phospholipase, partial [Chloroflexota bacterium]